MKKKLIFVQMKLLQFVDFDLRSLLSQKTFENSDIACAKKSNNLTADDVTKTLTWHNEV